MPEAAKNALLLVAALSLMAGGLTHEPTLMRLASLVAIAATLAQWTRLALMPRIFVVGALVAGPAVLALYPDKAAEMEVALLQGVAFSVLLSTIGVMRQAVRRSVIAAQATRYLICAPGRSRYAAVNVGCHFLSLLFNVGIVALIGDLLQGEGSVRVSSAERRRLLLASMRGTVLTTVWSPLGIGFAIITGGVAALDPVRFLVVSFAATLLILAATCVAFGAPEAGDLGAAERRSVGPVLVLLGVSAVLLAAAIALHELSRESFTLAAATAIPLFSLAWIVIEPVDDGKRVTDHLAGMFYGLSDMRGESAIFLSANVIGAAISILIRTSSVWGALQVGAWPDLWIIGACLIVIPLAGAAMIPHSIFVVLVVQLFGNGAAGHHHPMSLALSLMLAWALAITVSPISALSLITGRLSGVSARVVGFDWNARFFAMLMALSAAVVALSYRLGL